MQRSGLTRGRATPARGRWPLGARHFDPTDGRGFRLVARARTSTRPADATGETTLAQITRASSISPTSQDQAPRNMREPDPGERFGRIRVGLRVPPDGAGGGGKATTEGAFTGSSDLGHFGSSNPCPRSASDGTGSTSRLEARRTLARCVRQEASHEVLRGFLWALVGTGCERRRCDHGLRLRRTLARASSTS